MPSLDVQTIAAIIGLLLTGAGLLYAGSQLRETKRIARGDFLLRLDEMLQQHNEVHVRLRPGGLWTEGNAGPESVEDWIMIERYMGLFERIKVLIDNKTVDIDTIDRLYGYRVFNIVANKVIRRAKLEQEADSWTDFIQLWRLLEGNRKKKLSQRHK